MKLFHVSVSTNRSKEFVILAETELHVENLLAETEYQDWSLDEIEELAPGVLIAVDELER